MKVAILGASAKQNRYSNKAMHLLLEKGHEVVLINPGQLEIEGTPVSHSLGDIDPESIDTVTIYVAPKQSSAAAADLLALKPKRVIFNPGTENRELAEQLQSAGIVTVDDCTLVMLGTDQF